MIPPATTPAPSPISPLPDGLTWEPARRKFCVEVRVRPYPKKRKRFAATTPLGVMLAWRHTTINELTDARRVLERAAQANADPLAPTAAPAPLGTFRADVEVYITSKMPAALKATQPQWIRYLRTAARGELGRLPRQLITGRHWGDLLATWMRDGIPAELGDGHRRRIVKPKPITVATARKVRTAWITFYKTMDEGLNLPNPAKLCKRPADAPGAAPLPGGIPLADALAIVAQLPKGSRTGARIALMVLLGLRPCEIMRIDAAKDWNRRAKTLYVRTAKFGRPRTLPLEPAATAALQLLDTHPSGKGWGTFTSAPAARMFHAAVAKAGMGHYEPLVPYAMRHTFATNAYALSGDLKAVSEAIGHKSLKMTERYVEAAVSAQVAGLFGTIRKAKPKATKPKATTPKAGRGLRLVAGA